jgi:hypothetical protein
MATTIIQKQCSILGKLLDSLVEIDLQLASYHWLFGNVFKFPSIYQEGDRSALLMGWSAAIQERL